MHLAHFKKDNWQQKMITRNSHHTVNCHHMRDRVLSSWLALSESWSSPADPSLFPIFRWGYRSSETVNDLSRIGQLGSHRAGREPDWTVRVMLVLCQHPCKDTGPQVHVKICFNPCAFGSHVSTSRHFLRYIRKVIFPPLCLHPSYLVFWEMKTCEEE